MDLQPFVAQVQSHLSAVAALGDDRTRQTADSLVAAAEPALRLALMSALSAAAGEITVALLDSTGSPVVSCSLDGDEVSIDVRVQVDPDEPVEFAAEDGKDGDPGARISLRLSVALKNSIETAARTDSISVNSWLVRAAAAGLRSGATRPAVDTHRTPGHPHRVTGWING